MWERGSRLYISTRLRESVVLSRQAKDLAAASSAAVIFRYGTYKSRASEGALRRDPLSAPKKRAPFSPYQGKRKTAENCGNSTTLVSPGGRDKGESLMALNHPLTQQDAGEGDNWARYTIGRKAVNKTEPRP